MSAAANTRTVLAVVSVLLFAAIFVAGPAGGAQRDQVRPNAPANPHVTAATPSSVTIAWGAAADNVAVVGYDVYLGSKRMRVIGTSHVVRKLACGSAFAVGVAAVDAAGNRSRKALMVVSSAPCPDTTPPSAPAGFTQSATSQDAVVLVWQPSADDAGVVSYGLYRELARVGATFEPKATLTGLSCGSTDVVAIDAVDAAGNRSVRQQVYVETAACPTNERVAVLSATAASDDGSDWVRCAGEGQRCDFSGTSDVRYGANGSWTSPRSFTNGVSCTNRVFGDPLYGVVKTCERRSSSSGSTSPTPPSQWSFCAREGTSCAYTGTREVRYGANGKWTMPRTFSNGVACNNKVFGDPIYGVAKTCETRGVSSSPTPTPTPPPPAPPAPAPTPPDTSPPAKPILSIGAVGRNTATLSWQLGVDNVGVDHYAVWLDGSLVTRTTGTSHTYTDLECDTQYVLGLQVVDAAGNTSVLAEALWAIRTTACSSTTSDRQAPTAPAGLGVSGATQTSVRLGWSASTDNVGVTGYDVEKDGSLATTVTSPGATVPGLACGTSYGFGVKAFDAAGNRSAASSVVGSTSPCSDTQAPTAPTNVTASSRTATSIALSWSPSTDNTGVVGYGLYRGGLLTGTTSTPPGIFPGLTCNTNYTLAIDAYDASGNRSPRVTIAAGTTACPDSIPPSTPGGLAPSNVTQTGLTLGWSASTDNVGVAGYDVFRGGTKVATTTATTSSQTGLACATSYGFSVQAFDAAGNRSGQMSVTVMTAACPSPPPSGSASIAVAPGGNDAVCARGDLSKPCATFNRAYQIAQCGDVVQIGSGTYGSQSIVRNSRLDSCSSSVVLQGSGSVYVDREIRFGSCNGCYSSDGPANIVLRNVAYKHAIWLWGNPRNIVIDGVNGGGINLNGDSSNIIVRNSDFGPCNSSGSGTCERVFVLGNVRDVVFERNVIHDYMINQMGDHFECVFATSGTNVTWRYNRFFNCDTYDLRLVAESPSDAFVNWLVENNWFGHSGGIASQGGNPRRSAIVIAGGTSQILIRFNSFAPPTGGTLGQSVVNEGGQSNSGTRIIGNILGASTCIPGPVYAYNIVLGAPCGPTDRSVTALRYVNPSGAAAGDYHLTGAAWEADNLVPAAGPDYTPSVDLDGNARTTPRDAGADER